MPRTTTLADVHADFKYETIPENYVLDLCRQLRKSMIAYFFETPKGQAHYRDLLEAADQKGAKTE